MGDRPAGWDGCSGSELGVVGDTRLPPERWWSGLWLPGCPGAPPPERFTSVWAPLTCSAHSGQRSQWCTVR